MNPNEAQRVAVAKIRSEIDRLVASLIDLNLYVGAAEGYSATQRLKEAGMWLDLADFELSAEQKP